MTRSVAISSRTVVLLAEFVVFALAALPALAAQPAEVEDLIRRGGELRKKGQDAAALPLYQRAYELAATPRTAAQLGLVEVQLGYKLEAEAHLAEALAARDEIWIDRYRPVLEEQLAKVRSQIGEVAVAGTPAGALVTINGRERGRLPLAPVRLVAGPARIEVTAEGYNDASATVQVRGGGSERVVLNLPPQAGARAAGGAALGSSGSLPVSTPGPRDESPPWSPGKIAGATLLGAGILAVAGGATMLLWDKQTNCDHPMDASCSQRIQTRVPGWSLIGGGVAVGAVGGWLIYSSSSAQVTAGISPSSIVIAGRF